MLYSNERRLAEIAWLKENNIQSFENHLRLHKFLFFYESLCKVYNQDYDFEKLHGYAKGPIFAPVYVEIDKVDGGLIID